MSEKKASNGKQSLDAPKVEVNPAYSDEEDETLNIPADKEMKKKSSYASSDSGAYSLDDPAAKQVLEKSPEHASNLGVKVGESSHHIPPEGSPKSRLSRSPIKKIAAGAEALLKVVKDAVRTLSPKKEQLTDFMEVEYERPEPQSPQKEKPKKTKRVVKKLSEMYESVSSESENIDTGTTYTTSVPVSDQISVDEKSDVSDPFVDNEGQSAKDDSDAKEEK